MATTRDIATRAGVSAMTVSNILRGKPGSFSPATRAKVLAVVKELGYRVPAAAPGMRSGGTDPVALIYATVGAPFWLSADLTVAIQGVLEEAGRNLLLCRADPHRLSNPGRSHIPRIIRETRAAGVLVNSHDREKSSLIAASLHDHPTVMLNHHQDTDAVSMDDLGSGAAAYGWLKRQRCRRVAFISQWGCGHSSLEDRRTGFLRASQTAGDDEMAILAPADGTLHLEALVDRALDLGIDGACCFSQAEASVLARQAQRRGMSQSDLRVVVFYDQPFSYGSWQMATCVLPFAELGRRGAAMLLRRIGGGDREPSVCLPIPLIEPPWAWPG